MYAALFGLGYGGVFSVGWALALDAIPELGDVARDLGIWGTLSNLPGDRGAGDRRLDHRARRDAAPRLSIALRARRGVASRSARWSCCASASVRSHRCGSLMMLSLIVVTRLPWLALNIRIRQFGGCRFAAARRC